MENDGYRMLIWARPEGVLLQSRRGTDLTPAFPEIAEAAAALGDTTVLDGEVVIYRSGRLAFAALQQRLHRTSRAVARLAAAEPAHFVTGLRPPRARGRRCSGLALPTAPSGLGRRFPRARSRGPVGADPLDDGYQASSAVDQRVAGGRCGGRFVARVCG
ncbi:hypothetical protein ACFWUZ_02330 [Streptomyces sp. NPDC058646]|uniref:ATP-dependent DNA ligase n=1 Tax=Streptomyces sp. NPDC058646 TaxID=3346574 RepID=UPI00364B5B7A